MVKSSARSSMLTMPSFRRIYTQALVYNNVDGRGTERTLSLWPLLTVILRSLTRDAASSGSTRYGVDQDVSNRKLIGMTYPQVFHSVCDLLPKDQLKEHFVERKVNYPRVEHCLGYKLSNDTEDVCPFSGEDVR